MRSELFTRRPAGRGNARSSVIRTRPCEREVIVRACLHACAFHLCAHDTCVDLHVHPQKRFYPLCAGKKRRDKACSPFIGCLEHSNGLPENVS